MCHEYPPPFPSKRARRAQARALRAQRVHFASSAVVAQPASIRSHGEHILAAARTLRDTSRPSGLLPDGMLPSATKSFAHAVTSPEHVFENALCIETEFVLGADWFLFCTRTPKREGSAKVDALYRGL